ncbi:hypothetical protein [Avibacterium paragallinarum]|uniref:hypothetical protein n=1 Tax=Avibacterium paragallinarum TaxID=728 RepID=UPI00102A574E|nr:hypothetical protein [Avibacterium paragallinarum]RZN58625.1 hypothetical protein EIG78_04120 [Avibacterium paragallinarum]
MFKKFFANLFKSKDNIKSSINQRTEITDFKAQISIPAEPGYFINFDKQLKQRIENALSKYDFVKKDKIEFLANEIINNHSKYSKDILSLDEKRKLGLNTRAKYARSFIECFSNVENLNFDPKLFCQNLLYTERTILYCLDDIDRLKKNRASEQFIIEEQIITEEKEEFTKKIYNINEIPVFEEIDYTKKRVLFFVIANIDLDI